jgi:hypothetical protein
VSALALPAGSPTLRVGFVALTIVIGALFVLAVYWSSLRTELSPARARRRALTGAVFAVGWIAFMGTAATRGLLHFEPPPTMLVAILVSLGLAIGLALSPLGKRMAIGIPIAALVGYQGFRVIVELLMHRAYTEGLMPVQMSFSGRNFDIVTGITALALGIWLATGRGSRGLVAAWNTIGVLLLVNILVIALLSAPTPLRRFTNDPPNVWITRAPWVWLPTVMVFAAVFGHVAVYRRLASGAGVLAGPRRNDNR